MILPTFAVVAAIVALLLPAIAAVLVDRDDEDDS
jgi:hypothetical protein